MPPDVIDYSDQVPTQQYKNLPIVLLYDEDTSTHILAMAANPDPEQSPKSPTPRTRELGSTSHRTSRRWSDEKLHLKKEMAAV